MKRMLGFGVLAVFLLVAGWAILRSPKPRPRSPVTVQVAGITNDPSGIRHATLLLSNAGNHAVYLVPTFGLENRSGQWRTNLIPAKAIALHTNLMGVLSFHPRSKQLGAGQSWAVMLPLPFDDSGWRAQFWYVEDDSPLTSLANKLSSVVGLKQRQSGPQIAFTDWTER